jgi:hypothetical protein
MLAKTCLKNESLSAYIRKKVERSNRFFIINHANTSIKFISIIMLTVMTSANILQSKISFDGKWTINISKSEFNSLKPDLAPKQIIVKQTLDSIALTKTFEHPGTAPQSYTQIFSYNGKPTERLARGGVERRVISIAYKSDTLIFTTQGYVNNQGLKWEYTATENWSLSQDGKILTVQRKAVLPDRTETYKAVYNKQ